MLVEIRLFAALRERAGTDRLALELAEGAVVADALRELSWLTGDLHAVMAVNREYADGLTVLAAGDELALIPPVSGGAEAATGEAEAATGEAGARSGGAGAKSGEDEASLHVRVTDEPLSVDRVGALVSDARAGAIVTFQGVTREVAALEYEAYAEMAQAKIGEISRAAAAAHGLCAVAVEHRIGTVALSEASVVIAVSAPHRAQAFAGARQIIDALKESVPIWKREEGEWAPGQPVTEPGADETRS